MLDHLITFLLYISTLSLTYKSFYAYWNSPMGWNEYLGFSWKLFSQTFLPVKYVDGEDKKNVWRKIANIALYSFYVSSLLLFLVYKYVPNNSLDKIVNPYIIPHIKPQSVLVDGVGKPISDSEKAKILDSMKDDMKFKREPKY